MSVHPTVSQAGGWLRMLIQPVRFNCVFRLDSVLLFSLCSAP